MKKNIYILFFILSINLNSQIELRHNPYVKGSVVFKNGNIIKGVVRLNSSAFDIRFKDSLKQRKAKKVKFKEVEKIITYTDSLNPREFYYKKTDESKFLYFVELIHSDTISTYVSSSDRVALFYSESNIDRRTGKEWMDEMQNEHALNFIHHQLSINQRRLFYRNYSLLYARIRIEKIDYFLHKKDQKALILVGSKGNPLYKNFKKAATKYFQDCPALVEKIQSRELKLKHLPEIIEFYKLYCN